MRFFSLTIIYFMCLSLSLSANEVGAWYKSVEQIPELATQTFHPGFIILKIAAFSKKGNMWGVQSLEKIQEFCGKGEKLEAWVTHKIGKRETLGQAQGAVFAKELNTLIKNTCIKRIEIDLEPLKEASPWLLDFLGVVKAQTPGLEIRLAVPALSAKALPGHSWTKNSIEKVLEKIDGVDIMLYDTGLKSSAAYTTLVKEALRFSLNKGKGKAVVLGLPAYQDKTKFHHLETENLTNVQTALETFTPQELVPLCLKKIRLSYYAGWTLFDSELQSAKKLDEWYSTVCKKDH